MNFIWSEPRKHPNSECYFPANAWSLPIIAWLNYNDVWPKVDQGHWDLSYNYVWHFFDISIFECHLPGHGRNPRRAIEAMERYLSSTNLEWKASSATWRWDTRIEDGTRWARPGTRFFIYAVDHHEPSPTPLPCPSPKSPVSDEATPSFRPAP